MHAAGYRLVVVVDQQFPTDNELDIPVLDLGMQADGLELPLLAWGSIKRGKRINRGSWHFYTDDFRFKGLWDNPDQLLATEANGAIEPNLSIFPQTPVAVAIELTYKKRWLARYWQEHGVKIWVDINVAYEHSRLNLVGVPQGWRAYATHGYSERLEDLDYEYSIARERCGSEPLFLVYGGGKAVADRCKERGWIHSQEHRNWIRESGLEAVKAWQREAVEPAAARTAAE